MCNLNYSQIFPAERDNLVGKRMPFYSDDLKEGRSSDLLNSMNPARIEGHLSIFNPCDNRLIRYPPDQSHNKFANAFLKISRRCLLFHGQKLEGKHFPPPIKDLKRDVYHFMGKSNSANNKPVSLQLIADLA